MSVAELFERAARAAVFLYVEDEKLKFRARKNTLPQQLRHEISANKQALIHYLKRLQSAQGASRPTLPPLTKQTRGANAPLSFAQQRLWLVDQLHGSTQYNMTGAFRLTGRLDIPAFRRAIAAIIDRHEILRTTFAARDGVPIQTVQYHYRVPLTEIDLSEWPPEEQEQRLTRLAQADATTPFDLTRDLMLRVHLLTLSPAEHVVLFNAHHIAADAWSIGVLTRDLNALYATYSRGEQASLPPLPIQYADFAHWEQSWLEGEVLEHQLQYWRERLEGLQTLHLPTDRPRPAIPSFKGAQHTFKLPTGLTDRLRQLSRREGATLYMVLLTALQIVLARQSGQTDVAVGSPTAGRTDRQLENLIGCFVNTLVVRTDLSGDPAFAALLARVKEVTIGAYAHQDIPFERLVAQLQPERDLSRQPLYQVAFAWLNFRSEPLDLAGLKWQGIRGQHVTAKYDLLLLMYESAAGLAGGLEYAADLFDAATVARLVEQFERVLDQVAARPEIRLSELQLLGLHEREQLLHRWNETTVPYPKERCVHELFVEQARRTPTAIAVECEGLKLDYAGLHARSNQLARYLRKLGVGPETIVGLCVERSLEMLVGLLGVLKAGAAYLPLDPVYPAERLELMLTDSATAVVLTQASLEEFLPGYAGTAVLLDQHWPLIAREAADGLDCELSVENLAYVIYTSGSTGAPKGSMLTHSGVVNYLSWAREAYRAAAGCGAPVNTSFAFDATVTSLLTPLLSGGCVELLSMRHGDIAALGTALESGRNYSLVKLTPAHLRALQQSHPDAARETRAGAFVIGGEALSAEEVEHWRTHAPQVRLINEYGPTETVVGCIAYVVDPDTPHTGPIPIGRPVANTRVYVLDERLEPVPVGVAGELFIGGAGVARGYLNRGDLTAERFVADPFSADGQRLYRTGDRVKYRADGILEFLGRMDEQVKIHGYRIEPGEIEAALRRLPDVRQAVVLPREDRPGEKKLVAYIVPTASPAGDDQDQVLEQKRSLSARCSEALRTMLPHYMVPGVLVFMEELPLTPHGKLDRARLPAPSDGDVQRQAYVAPRNKDEAQLCAIWQDVLGLEQVGIHDDFFGLGGHSLLAMKTISLVREHFAAEIPLRCLFQERTPARLARALPEFQLEDVLPPVEAGVSRSGAPLSYAQRRLWFIDQLGQGSAQYNIPVAFRLRGSLDVAALERTLRAIIERHEVLRTRFVTENGEPVQIVQERFALPLKQLDLTALGADEQQREIRRLAREDAERSFDLKSDVLLRVQLLKQSAAEHVVLFNLHHIASDGWSAGILIRELSALYQSRTLPELKVQYADYALWQRRWLQGERLDKHLEYWRGQLAGIPEVHGLPTDKPRPAQQSFRGGRYNQRLPGVLAGGLKALCRSEDVTLFMLLHAAFSVLLSRYSGHHDIVVGSATAGRVHKDLEPLIGFFVNDLVLRSRISASEPFVEHLARMKRTIVEAYAHQLVPYEMLVEHLNPHRSLRHDPIIQIKLDVQNNEQVGLEIAGLQLQRIEPASSFARYDLWLTTTELQNELVLDWVYRDDLFLPVAIERLAWSFHALLENIVADAHCLIQNLQLLTQSERKRLLPELDDADATLPYGRPALIHELFEEQVARTPDATAVVCEGIALGYDELNRRSNQLAHYLRDRGVRADQRVALCVERSLEMVVGILGILKAGGGYVPLDPGYPPERLGYMLEDAAPRVLLTQESLREALPETAMEVIALDRDWAEIARRPRENPGAGELELRPDHLAYVIYTSGSTGMPKGVMVEHRHVTRLFAATRAWFNFTQRDVWTLFHSFAFDFSVWELWGALLHGGRVILVPGLTARSADDFYRLLCEQGVTVLNQTPSAFAQLSDAQVRHPGLSHNLREIIFGGEALELRTLRDWVKRNGAEKPRLVNMYGITETTVHVTCQPLTLEQIESGSGSRIGVPLPDLRVYLLDPNRQPVPAGVVGEMYVRGAGVSRGYLNRPELSAERFLCLDGLGRLYKTGDLGRWRSDGALEYIGRNDDQVKIRGFRIELGEIEAHLAQHNEVKEAVVLAREDASGEKRLVAYVIAADTTTAPSAQALRAHLGRLLPDHMLPSAFVMLGRLPLTTNGKLDRQALPAPESDAYVHRAFEAPEGEVEAIVAAIWQELLRVERVGRADNFFELGGHSLLIVQMTEKLRHAGFSAQIRHIFESATLADFASTLCRETTVEHEAPPNLIPPDCTAITPEMLPLVELDEHHIAAIVRAVPGGAANIQDVYPLTPLQQGILFHHRLTREGGDTYVLPILLYVPSRSKLDNFLAALQQVIDRHDILRTAVLWEGLPQAVQVVYRHATLLVEDLALDVERDPVEQLHERIRSGNLRLDLGQAPLLRVQIAADPDSAQWYVLLQTHHIVDDATSLKIVIAEVATCLEGRAHTLPPSMPYRNHVAQALAYARTVDSEAFFRSKLHDIVEPTAPFGLLDVHGHGTHVMEAQEYLDPVLARRVRHQAQHLGVSAATLFHAAWGLVVAQTSGRDDVVFGTVLLGRLQGSAGAQRILGMFINTLPLRLRLRDLTAQQLVDHTQRELVELMTHEQASLAVAQRCSGISGSAPLFTALLNYRHAMSGEDISWTDSTGIRVLSETEQTNYPILLSVNDLGEKFSLSAQTDTRLEASRITGYLRTALRSVLDALENAPQRPVCSLSILPESEWQTLRLFNATEAEYAREKLIHQLFEEQVERTPEAVAVAFEGQSLLYRELNAKANQLARHLRDKGVRPEHRVGVCLERSLEMLIGLLAILKAGGAYVPLDPDYPSERLAYMLEDAAPRVLLIQEQLRHRLPATPAERIVLDEGWHEFARYSCENLDPRALGHRSSHLAYVIYTSGSTGTPKGVMNEHRPLINRLQWMRKRFALGERDRFLHKTPFSFDVSVWELFVPLSSGARLIVARPEGHRDPAYLRDLIEASGATATHFVPSMLEAFLHQHEPGRCSNLRHVFCSGEELSAPLQRKLFDCLPQVRLTNLYGPTEAAIEVTVWECERNDPSARVPIGRPIWNTQIHVLDALMQPVPTGVTGEIYIAGASVARGYLNRPQLTAERFVADPFSTEPRARMYKTGDLGRWRADGAIEYLGRNDQQIKIRGFRVELGEIESVSKQLPDVRDAAVLIHTDAEGQKALVAYVVPRERAAAVEESTRNAAIVQLKHSLQARLPAYMVPSIYVLLEALPSTGSGKVNRRALSAPAETHMPVTAYEAPRDLTELQLCDLWQTVLKVDRIGVHDNFFDLGGHSLRAMRLVDLVRKRFTAEVPLHTLFGNPTIRSFAQALRELSRSSALPVLGPMERNQRLPLSYAQQRLWLIDQMGAGSAQYNMPAVFELSGELNIAAFERAIRSLIERHEALRTHFAAEEGEPCQVIAERVELPVTRVDLSKWSESQQTVEVERLALEEAQRVFDLQQDVLLRVQLLKCSERLHVLLLTMHHIASDGWSLEILLQELTALYEAFRSGQPPTLAPLPVQYADYALWQRQWLSGERLEQQLSYWQRQLSGVPLLHGLPTDNLRPSVQSYRGRLHRARISAQVRAALKELCQRQGVTLFTGLHACFAVLLARQGAERDIVVGTPVANRDQEEVAGLIGCFVNTLVLRSDLSGHPSFKEVLRQSQARLLEGFAHQQVPFEQVVERLQPQRSSSHGPLFQIMLSLQEQSARERSRTQGLHLRRLDLHGGISKLDLTVVAQDEADGLNVSWEYASDLFEPATIERLADQFEVLIESLARTPDEDVFKAPLMREEAYQRLFERACRPCVQYPVDRCAPERFEAHARANPDRVALCCDDEELTYRELNARANQLARYLMAHHDVRPQSLVGLCLERSSEMVVGILGVLKAGAAYVPLDPGYPRARLEYIIADARLKKILTTQALQEQLGLEAGQAICWDDPSLQTVSSSYSTAELEVRPQPEDLAYIIYTSGSTGRPKGVMVEHRQITRLMQSTERYYDFGADDVWTLFHSYAFDFSVWEMWGALLYGGSLVVVPRRVARSPEDFHKLLARRRVSVLCQTPSAFQSLVREPSTLTEPLLKSLRYVIFGGEALHFAALKPWMDRYSEDQPRLINMYGITETTVHSSYLRVRREMVESASGASPIGEPLPDLQLLILDEYQALVPPGVVGEIHVGGAGVTRGYLNLPELTAERFIQMPRYGNGRFYRSGDLARMRADGSLDYAGRADHQVKIRGFRIELGEIEAALQRCRGVRETIVVTRPDSSGEERLLAYLVGQDPGQRLSPEALRSSLAASLPEYMLPAAYVQLDSLPLTLNGKLDRKALPEPSVENFGAHTFVPPRGALEESLAALWCELLALPRVGRQDHFFLLGGHSLLAVQLVSRIRSRLGREVALTELFAKPRLADLAGVLAGAADNTLPAIVPVARTDSLPLSFAQQRLWFLAQLDPRASAAYLIPGGIRLSGVLDTTALSRALDRIVARHEALRTRFVATDQAPVQLISPPEVGFALTRIDLSALPDSEAHALRHAAEEACTAFDLEHGPIVRGRLLKLSERDHVLLVTMHHIVSDGWSMGVFVRELCVLYAAFSQGQDDPLPRLPIQYVDFAVWQRNWLTGEVMQRQLKFWCEHLRGVPDLLEHPTDRARPPVQNFAGQQLTFELDEQLTAALKDLGQRHGCTLFMILLAAWATLLARLSGQQHVVIGSPVANRNRGEIEPLIGFFANTHALHIDFSSQPRLPELLAQVRATSLAAQEHQDLPFEQLIEALNPPRSLSHAPVCQVMFTWHGAPEGELSLPDLQLSGFGTLHASVKFDLELSMQQAIEGTHSRISGSLIYATALFEHSRIQRHIEQLKTLLHSMVSHETERVARLSLLPSSEEQRLRSFNDTPKAPSSSPFIHELFEEQVTRTNGATALVCEDGACVSYAQLNLRANQLAHHLISLGVGPDVLVAICLPRSPEMVIAILAVLKAGGAYVPLDPGYPAERLTYMLDDSRARVMLAREMQRHTIPNRAALMIALDEDWPRIARLPASNPRREDLRPDHLLYVIYTSGSTGVPKAAQITHRGFGNLLNWYIEDLQLSRHDAVLLLSSHSFDLTQKNILGPLLVGGMLSLAGEPFDPRSILDQIERRSITHINLSPGAFHALIDADNEGRLQRVRRIVLGGEPVQVARLASLREPRPLFINSYGPTECSDVVGWHVLSADLATYTSQGVPLGKPVRNTSLYALDRALQPVPIGVTGEVYIAGVQVGRGYLNRPAPTAERFLPDPFGPAGARMYRTGDLGRWRADGLFEFLGRNDHQVKLRGFRIELGEIEAALMNVPGVKAALVLARELAGMEKRLVACCGLSDPAQNEESIRASLRARLPDYMIPQHFVLLDDLPLTSNGKVDRARLLALDVPQPRSKQVAPRTLLESHLCEVWQDALDLDEVGVTDNIFALGGDSMRVVRLVRRAAARGIFIHVRDIFACQTVAELSRFVTANLGTVTRRDQPAPLQVLAENFSSAPYIQADVEDCYPATSMQQLMWTMSRHPSAGDGVYQPQMLFELNDIDLSVDTLTAALGYLIDKHPTLRTRFVEAPDGQLVQLVFSHLDPRLPSLDLTAMPESEQERHIRELILADAQQRFQLGQPAIRLAVLKLTQRRWGLLISCHHAIEDGWGFIELNNELLALYDSLARGGSLPARQARANVFKEYVALQMEARKSALHRQAWQELLRGYQPMPALAPGPLARLAITSVPMRADLIRQLKQQAARNDASMKAIFLLAWLRALARVLRTDVVTVDIVSSGRSARLSDPFGAVGLFWSFMPVCSAGIMDDPSPLRALTARLSTVDTHALYPVDAIAEIAVPRGEPLTYAAFNFVHFHNQKTAAQSGWTCAPRYASDRFHHALKLIVSMHPAQTLARLECDRRYVDETRQEALGRFLEQELETLSAAAPGDGQYSAT